MSNTLHATRFIHDLVSIPSPSGDEHAAVHRFIAEARALGLNAEIDAAGSGHALCPAHTHTASAECGAEIVLLGHIDTVPGHIPVRIQDGVLHGRGSVDAKGPLAAMLYAAAQAIVPSDVTVRVVAAVGEETPHSPGARHLAATLRPQACFIGEPSGWDGVTLGYKGRLVMHADLTLANGHSAGPHGSSPDALLAFWQQVLGWTAAQNAAHSGAFETIQAGIRSFQSNNTGLFDRAMLSAGFRLPRWLSPHQLEAHLRALIAGGDCAAHTEIRFEGHEHAFATDRNDAVARALSMAIRSEGGRPHPKLKTGTSDLNVVAPIWNCPIAAYGPGDSSLDHTPTEHLVLEDFHRSIRVLTQSIKSLAEELSRCTPHAELIEAR
jgi:LysW-gamma-L-lysine carboxypeptidase